ncbi:MAG TPA: PAS domain-containing sensor histidine kinase [Candidatus Saccharimonadales bacterium]|nr:PAS domain-containing sensor histidine kinase [Candidatus Saccharimonadales bacterium]
MSDEQNIQNLDYKTLIDDSPDIIARFDRELRYVYANRTTEKVFEKPASSLVGKTNKDLNMLDAQEKYWSKNISEVFQTGNEATIELNFESSSLGKQFFQARIVPEKLPDGTIPYVITVAYDITELKNYEDVLKKRSEELEEAQARDEAILENIGDGLIVTDNAGKITIMNQAAQTMLGWEFKDVVNRPLVEVITMADEKDQIITPDELPTNLALKNGKKTSATFYFRRHDDTKFPASVVVTPLIISGSIIGSIEAFRDITHEKEIEEMKTEFIALTSHELRTPLSAIRGYLSMIDGGDYGPINTDLEKPLSALKKSTDRLIHIVNEMLDVSRIEAEKMSFSLTEQNMLELVKEVTSTLQSLFNQKNITLEIKESEPIIIQTDKEKTIEILNNLIGNSLKFTEKGSISISLEQKGDKMIVYIADTGIGIAKEFHSKLFSKFDEIKLKQAGITAGTGLGLYISYEMVKRMGGELWIENSEIGKGSTFAFSLPLAKSELAQKTKDARNKEMKLN